jgi:hypothetical protein
MVCTHSGNAFVDSGTWKAGGDLGDFVDSAISVFILVWAFDSYTNYFDAILRVDYGFGITKMVHKG